MGRGDGDEGDDHDTHMFKTTATTRGEAKMGV